MKQLFLIVTGCFFSLAAMAQQPSKEDLQKKNQELTQEIESIRSDLKRTSGDKKVTLGLLAKLNRTIEARNQIINNIKGEVYYIEKDIIRNYREVDTLKKELDTLKVQYAKSIVYAYKNRSNYDFLNFLFSAGNFNDALRRIAYLKTYRQYRENQATQISRTNNLLKSKIESLTVKRKDKGNALTEQSKQMTVLAQDKKVQNDALNQLQSREKELTSSINKKEAQKREVARSIKRLIDEAIAKARREEAARVAAAREKAKQEEAARARAELARKAAEQERIRKYRDSIAEVNLANLKNKAPIVQEEVTRVTPKATAPTKVVGGDIGPIIPGKAGRPSSELENTPEGIITSTQFEKNKNALPWPVDRRTVVLHFGMNTIPAKPRPLNISSDGITMETEVGAAVKVIFEGEILSVESIGDKVFVFAKHGKYFTGYSNLEVATVKVGQKVSRGQVIGKAGANDDGVGEVDLTITNERGAFLNPEAWLR